MNSISKENERNAFEEYLQAYLREHPEAAEEHRPRMQYIDETGYYFRKHKGLSVLFDYGIESDRLNTAYFKVYDHNDYFLAKRAARLHFKDSGMEYHRDPYEKQQWILNSKDIKRIRDLLKDINDDDYYLYHDYNTYTNWKILCYQWNHENGLIPASASITDYYSGKYDNDGSQLNNAYVPSTQKIPEAWNYEPPEACADSKEYKIAFKTGDIVNVTEADVHSDSVFVVREAVLMDIGVAMEYMYDVSPIDQDDEIYTYKASSLEYLYHDSVWEKYFDEAAQNDLPAWRGELYNTEIFSHNYILSYRDSWELIKEHNHDTIPPVYMEHILEWHSVFGRIDIVLDSTEDVKEIGKLFNINRKDLHDLQGSLREKIYRCNMSEIDPDYKKEINNKQKFRFTDSELALASEIDKRDIFNGEYNEHFPAQMTNLQIMEAIKQAYHAAHKISPRKLQVVYDRREDRYFGEEDGKMVYPVKGKILYEGTAKNGMAIQFWYNFDLDLIEDAYPVRMNNGVKKNET